MKMKKQSPLSSPPTVLHTPDTSLLSLRTSPQTGVAISRNNPAADHRYSPSPRICPNCGTQFAPKRDSSRFCNTKCSKAWHQRSYRRQNADFSPSPCPQDVVTCTYNGQVICGIKACEKCGWNPAVTAARIAAIINRRAKK